MTCRSRPLRGPWASRVGDSDSLASHHSERLCHDRLAAIQPRRPRRRHQRVEPVRGRRQCVRNAHRDDSRTAPVLRPGTARQGTIRGGLTPSRRNVATLRAPFTLPPAISRTLPRGSVDPHCGRDEGHSSLRLKARRRAFLRNVTTEGRSGDHTSTGDMRDAQESANGDKRSTADTRLMPGSSASAAASAPGSATAVENALTRGRSAAGTSAAASALRGGRCDDHRRRGRRQRGRLRRCARRPRSFSSSCGSEGSDARRRS
jgi:hypothetical protein